MKIVLMLAAIAQLTGCGNLLKSGALVDAESALRDSRYETALESTEIAESFGQLSITDTARLYYLRAQALEGLNRRHEASITFQYVIDNFNNSVYATLSKQRVDASGN